MKSISFKTWITWALVLFGLGLLADYYFLHILFHQKQAAINGAVAQDVQTPEEDQESSEADDSFLGEKGQAPEASATNKDNFLESLQKCAPEVAAQAIATPEALIEYLQKSVGVKTEEISLENYHLTLADGSKRRVHVITSDNSNSPNTKEIRFFKLDEEGYPERLPLKGNETVESLLAQGTVTKHEAKSQLLLKDGSTVSLEMHDKKVFEFQFNNHGKLLSCRFKDCHCPQP
ncbi:hypothetical protein QJS83_00230 [Bdellovibrio sp. 22V]|uniref:hypothetical protein n=1 Tax=Bdellovibrio TaxID=958 RepID=UPI002542C51E|nr:hypothetical protein [Bdellovibrio sp. 22V]WII72292.1 hypothetical protein QJS83_00230 [Bdellovibrio sp. 22V]